MLEGIIKTKDILIHPILIIHILGVLGFFKMMGKIFSHRRYHFINFLHGGNDMKIQIKTLFVIATIGLLWIGCGGGAKEGDSSDNGGPESGDCIGGGWCGEESITLEADLSGATALFTLQDTSSSVLGLETADSLSRAVISNQSKFYKLMENGTYEEVISAFSSTQSDAMGDLPLISFIAANEQGDVFIAYQHPFMYRTPPANYSDPWAPSSPYTCQLFKVRATISEFAQQEDAADGGLCCITNSLELDTWDYRTNKIQFDSSGNAYFTAHVPQNWKNVMIKWDRFATPEIDSEGMCTYPSSALSEVINANIVFRDYLVVPTGGVFYTGFTSAAGDYYDDDSFLRFLGSDGQLQEITSGWWDYIFQPVGVEDMLLGIDASLSLDTSVNERVIFYGPDPLVATSPEWDDSCLFLYNPNESGSNRSTEIADCEIDIWNYVGWADDIATRRSRCAETKYMMGGGNQPKKILLSDSYDENGNYIRSDDSTGADDKKEIFVVGDIYSKKAGEWRYDLCVNEGPHCVDSNDVPDYTHRNDRTSCENAGGTWKTHSDCYGQLTDTDLYTILTSGDAVGDGNWQLSGEWCESPGGDWRETYSGFARVNYTDADNRSITLLSYVNEIVKNGWAVNERLYYVAFNVEDGNYYLMEVGRSDAILTGFEVYELFKDPNNSNKLYFNGLRFSDNAYVMGTFDPDDTENTLSIETGLTGQIETLIVIPDYLLQ